MRAYRLERNTAIGREPVNEMTFGTLALAKRWCEKGWFIVRDDGATWYCGPTGAFRKVTT